MSSPLLGEKGRMHLQVRAALLFCPVFPARGALNPLVALTSGGKSGICKRETSGEILQTCLKPQISRLPGTCSAPKQLRALQALSAPPDRADLVLSGVSSCTCCWSLCAPVEVAVLLL